MTLLVERYNRRQAWQGQRDLQEMLFGWTVITKM